MNNKEIARYFYEIADMLAIKGENRYRILAYRPAADQIAGHVRDSADLWRAGSRRGTRRPKRGGGGGPRFGGGAGGEACERNLAAATRVRCRKRR